MSSYIRIYKRFYQRKITHDICLKFNSFVVIMLYHFYNTLQQYQFDLTLITTITMDLTLLMAPNINNWQQLPSGKPPILVRTAITSSTQCISWLKETQHSAVCGYYIATDTKFMQQNTTRCVANDKDIIHETENYKPPKNDWPKSKPFQQHANLANIQPTWTASVPGKAKPPPWLFSSWRLGFHLVCMWIFLCLECASMGYGPTQVLESEIWLLVG